VAITSLPDAAPELPVVLLAGFRSSYADRLAAQLGASRKLAVIDAAVPWHGVDAALELHRPEAVVVCDETLDIVELAMLAREYHDTGIVVLARQLRDARARALDACGAAAMLKRDVDPWLLVFLAVAVARGFGGGIHKMRPTAVGRADVLLERLSEREIVVSEFLRGHRRVRDIAAALAVSADTINSQAQSIYRKLGVSSRNELRGVLQDIEAPALDPEPSVLRIERATRERVAFKGRDRRRWQEGWVRRPLLALVR
jgi:DNA-binding NarL/FixJ family response regulator